MKSSELFRLFTKAGWKVVRQDGTSHRIMRHPDHEELISLPFHGAKEVSTGLANKLLKQAGLK